VAVRPGRLRLDAAASIGTEGSPSERIGGVARRLADGIARLTGRPAPPVGDESGAAIVLAADTRGAPDPSLPEIESYRLRVTEGRARIDAATPAGVNRGIETLLQLAEPGPNGPEVAGVEIDDAPRFPWRGLLLDVCRHWYPVEDVLRTIDAMAAVKLNVLHLHLTEDQAFRFECRAFPRLHEGGSEGRYYAQNELHAVVAHAASRDVRVVPELDVPGHVTSWLVGHPELAATPGPFALRREFGIAKVALDPENDRVYELLDVLLGELAEIFPDEFVHIGGDEVDAAAWPHIDDARAAQAAFTDRVVGLAAGHGRRSIVWDEAMHPDLRRDVVVQAWRGAGALHRAVRAGHDAILSAGWYLDHLYGARHLHAVEPLAGPGEIVAAQRAVESDPAVAPIRSILEVAHRWPDDPAGLTEFAPDDARRVLGGEACLWSELVTSDNLDQRIWPRAAAVADRLWSPAVGVAGPDDLERGLARLDAGLERTVGTTHRSDRARMLVAIAGDAAGALRVLSDALEPVKWYSRMFADLSIRSEPPDRAESERRYTTATPLDRVVDVTPPESATAARLAGLVSALDAAPAGVAADELAAVAGEWRAQYPTLADVRDERVAEVMRLAQELAAAADLLTDCVDALRSGAALSASTRAHYEKLLDDAAAPCAELMFAVGPVLSRLLDLGAAGRAPEPA